MNSLTRLSQLVIIITENNTTFKGSEERALPKVLLTHVRKEKRYVTYLHKLEATTYYLSPSPECKSYPTKVNTSLQFSVKDPELIEFLLWITGCASISIFNFDLEEPVYLYTISNLSS